MATTSHVFNTAMPFANNLCIGLGIREPQRKPSNLISFIKGLLHRISGELTSFLCHPVSLVWDDDKLSVCDDSWSQNTGAKKTATIAKLTIDVASDGLPVRASWPGIEYECHSVTALQYMFGHMILNPTVAAIIASIGGVKYATLTEEEQNFTVDSFVGGDRIVVRSECSIVMPVEGNTLTGKELP